MFGCLDLDLSPTDSRTNIRWVKNKMELLAQEKILYEYHNIYVKLWNDSTEDHDLKAKIDGFMEFQEEFDCWANSNFECYTLLAKTISRQTRAAYDKVSNLLPDYDRSGSAVSPKRIKLTERG